MDSAESSSKLGSLTVKITILLVGLFARNKYLEKRNAISSSNDSIISIRLKLFLQNVFTQTLWWLLYSAFNSITGLNYILKKKAQEPVHNALQEKKERKKYLFRVHKKTWTECSVHTKKCTYLKINYLFMHSFIFIFPITLFSFQSDVYYKHKEG